jgi:hypothetical protein
MVFKFMRTVGVPPSQASLEALASKAREVRMFVRRTEPVQILRTTGTQTPQQGLLSEGPPGWTSIQINDFQQCVSLARKVRIQPCGPDRCKRSKP